MKSTFILLLCCMCFACAKYPGVPEKYHALLDKALETSGTNQPELAKALESATPEMKEGVAFLISYMPERDLKTMKGDDLLSNVKLAYEARNRFAWAKSVPDSIFLNDVLPYASLNEERDQWRADFYKRFAPYVENFLIEIYRMESKRYLPGRVKELAEQFGFRYRALSFRNNISNWGSCSADNNISLNVKLMKLPDEIIDYVILHELCHTVEKNHSSNFWALMEKVCPGCMQLRRRLRQYNTRV